jgi:hypothetical protein
VLDNQHVRIYVTFDNTGKGSGSAQCVVNVTAYNPYGDEIGSGVTSIGTNSTLAPGQSQTVYEDVVVTDNNAGGVTSTKDVSIVTC